MRAIGIIPARYESKRFPGKPLAKIHGTSLIKRVYNQAKECAILDEVIVATDDQRILDHVLCFGKGVMTSSEHLSGTDRCLEAFELINSEKKYNDRDILINIQGDQPFILPEQIRDVIEALKHHDVSIATLATPITDQEEMIRSDVVKVVCGNDDKALYFSRLPIPFLRNTHGYKNSYPAGMKHIGVYGFRINTLRKIGRLPQGTLEQSEGLEQLRWLENGFDILVRKTICESVSIDRKEDIFNYRETSQTRFRIHKQRKNPS